MCVSHPGQRVSPHHFHTGRGAVSLIPSTAQRRRWFETVTFGEDALRTYLPNFFTRCYPTLPPFDSWSFMFPPHKHSSPAAEQPVRFSAACECQHCSTILFQLTFPPCCSIAFLPNVAIALTENPSSKCVLLSRPTRVLSVIPFTGALFLHGKATTPTLHRSLEHHRKAPTPSQNQPPHRPPGQKTVLEESFRFRTSDLRFQHSVFFSCFPIMCVFPCSLCCCRDSFIDRTQGWALRLFSLIRDA